ncbi:DUF6264 family protein [Microbacterium lacus]|uniref:DUF6264 family protein n=1 Tax=Microbacterium lacus TaxID=415217 RepID=UPI00384A9BC1
MSNGSSDGSDSRRRPAYGEYATAEEQRARIQQPAITEALDHGLPPGAAVAPSEQPVAAASVRETPARTVDRLITAVLLGIGFVNVVVSVQSFFDVTSTFTRAMETMGIPGEFTNVSGPTGAAVWGAVAGISMVIGYVLTALVSWRRVRGGRRAWWIPLVGAVITYVVVTACLTVPVMADPAFQEYVRTMAS